MSDKILAGVDFSGTKENPNESWLVVGRLGGLGYEVIDVKKTGSHILANELAAYKTLSLLAVDCPFSFPNAFLDFLAVKKIKSGYETWQSIVEELVFTPYDEFAALAKEHGKESKRFTDTTSGTTSFSPLKRSNPPMQHLTYHGMRALASLDPARFYVLPFQDTIPFGCAVMEVWPLDTLKCLGIKENSYQTKEKADGGAAEAQREKIVQDLLKLKERKALTFKDFPPLTIQKQLLHNFTKSHQAVDALISAYTAALFTAAPQHFEDPLAADKLEVLLEGWTYRVKQ